MKIANVSGGEWMNYRPGVIVMPLVGTADGAPVGLTRVVADPGAWLTPSEGEQHPQSETLMVQDGELLVVSGGEKRGGLAGSVVHIPAGEHHIICAGPEGADLMVVACPDWGATA